MCFQATLQIQDTINIIQYNQYNPSPPKIMLWSLFFPKLKMAIIETIWNISLFTLQISVSFYIKVCLCWSPCSSVCPWSCPRPPTSRWLTYGSLSASASTLSSSSSTRSLRPLEKILTGFVAFFYINTKLSQTKGRFYISGLLRCVQVLLK